MIDCKIDSTKKNEEKHTKQQDTLEHCNADARKQKWSNNYTVQQNFKQYSAKKRVLDRAMKHN